MTRFRDRTSPGLPSQEPCAAPEGGNPDAGRERKHAHVQQFQRKYRALRTETAINNSCDFGIGRWPGHFEDLRKTGVATNRRLLRVDCLSRDPAWLRSLPGLAPAHDHRAATGSRPAVPRPPGSMPAGPACWSSTCFPTGLANRSLWRRIAPPRLGLHTDEPRPSRASCDLRRYRMRVPVESILGMNCYRVTETGQRVALCCLRALGFPASRT